MAGVGLSLSLLLLVEDAMGGITKFDGLGDSLNLIDHFDVIAGAGKRG